jgi:hypothetical protein
MGLEKPDSTTSSIRHRLHNEQRWERVVTEGDKTVFYPVTDLAKAKTLVASSWESSHT